jgi:hypothetical protein
MIHNNEEQTLTTVEHSKSPKELIEEARWVLSEIRGTWYLMSAAERELEQVRQGRRFMIRNTGLWHALVRAWDMVIADLASWTRGVFEPGGLLGILQASAQFRERRRNSKERRTRVEDSDLEDILDRMHTEAFRKLFPDATDKARHTDIAALRDLFQKQAAHLIADRHAHRAHRHERRPDKEQEDVPRQSIDEVGRLFDACETLLNDLQHVIEGTTWADHDMNDPSSKSAAEDLVDLVLLGSRELVTEAFKNAGSREALYERLRSAYDVDDSLAMNHYDRVAPFLWPEEASGVAPE